MWTVGEPGSTLGGVRRRELFPADRGLQARMVLAAVLTPTVVVAALVACALVLPAPICGGIAIAAVLGIGSTVRERRRGQVTRVLAPGEEPELQAAVQRLCLMADLPRPDVAVNEESQPNSWVVDAPGRPPRLHVTRGLLDMLDAHELEAVLAHELSHIAHRDATVMTVVGLPGAVLQEGGATGGWWGWWPMQLGRLVALVIGRIASVGTKALSRHRELVADAGAASLTGRPSALASALLKVSGELARIPAADLRGVAGRDAFHLLPTRSEGGGLLWRLEATHPTLDQRLAALERLEARLQRARRAA
jgi:heat shock protein HtpX